jgi:hypothetical protein
MTVRIVKPVCLLLGLLAASATVGLARAEVAQVGLLRVKVDGNLSPKRLPRIGKAPVTVSVGWQIANTDGSEPQKLKTVAIQINHQGAFDFRGLPACPLAKIQPASTERALRNCRASRVGSGRFSAKVGLEGQERYVSTGKMILFGSEKNGKPVLYGHIYSESPFAISFVIPFEVSEKRKGVYGTSLTAVLPASLRAWGNLTEVSMHLSRNFSFKGERHSFLSAGCPVPKGFGQASFNLAHTNFAFEDGTKVSSTLTGVCKVR